jgi:hypothetical protein
MGASFTPFMLLLLLSVLACGRSLHQHSGTDEAALSGISIWGCKSKRSRSACEGAWKSCVWCVAVADDPTVPHRRANEYACFKEESLEARCRGPRIFDIGQLRQYAEDGVDPPPEGGVPIGRGIHIAGKRSGALVGSIVSARSLSSEGRHRPREDAGEDADRLLRHQWFSGYYPWRLDSALRVPGRREVLILSTLEDPTGAMSLTQFEGWTPLRCYELAGFNVRVRKVESLDDVLKALNELNDFSLDHLVFYAHGNELKMNFGSGYKLSLRKGDGGGLGKEELRLMQRKLKHEGHVILRSCGLNASLRGIAVNNARQRALTDRAAEAFNTEAREGQACGVVGLRTHRSAAAAGTPAATAAATDVHDLASLFRKMLPGRSVEANEGVGTARMMSALHSDPDHECLPHVGLGRASYYGILDQRIQRLTTFTFRSIPRCKLYPERGAPIGVCLGSCREPGAYEESCSGREKPEKGGGVVEGFGGAIEGRTDLLATRYTLEDGGQCKDTVGADGDIESPHVRTVCIVPPPEASLDDEGKAAWRERRALPVDGPEGHAMQDEVLQNPGLCPRLDLPQTASARLD